MKQLQTLQVLWLDLKGLFVMVYHQMQPSCFLFDVLSPRQQFFSHVGMISCLPACWDDFQSSWVEPVLSSR